MSKNNIDYWKKREEYKLKKGLKEVNKIEKEIVKIYKSAMDDIHKEILSFYNKYATDNNLEYKEACKLLRGSEYKQFRMDLKDYIALIDNEDILLELNTLSKKASISRLEDLLYQCSKYINGVYTTSEKRLQMCYSGTVKDNFYQSMYDIHKSIGVGASFSHLDNKMIEDILRYPWSGKNFSQALWDNRAKLNQELKVTLTKGIIQGKSIKDMAKDLNKSMDTNLYYCKRIVHTEHAYFMEQASKLAYKETGIEQYQYLATLDSRTSKACQSLDLKIFKTQEALVGVNYPPL
ncbi:minor capsid protein [Clostridium sp.]|uniref:minor capsid protein n=1 Tax=Clostridium sp. TaxID=1506 RepID=UPI003F328555